MMEETQVKIRPEIETKDAPARVSTLKSRFDDAEYARWSEKLRASRTKK